MAFAEKIYALRKKQGWSQEKLAEQLDVSRQTISKWELGGAMPELAKLRQISVLFSVTLDDLINEKELTGTEEQKRDILAPEAALEEQARPKRRKKLPVLAATGVAVIAFVFLLLRLFLPGKSYTDAQSVHTYLKQTINLTQPYASIELNAINAELVRTQMENDDRVVSAGDSILEEGISLFIAEYFSQFSEFDLVYHSQKNQLDYQGKQVSYFTDYDGGGTLTQIFWYSDFDGGLVLSVERSSRGVITGIENLSEFGD